MKQSKLYFGKKLASQGLALRSGEFSQQRFSGNIRFAREQDIPSLRPILETWIRDRNTGQLIPSEIEEVLSDAKGSVNRTNNITYLVEEEKDGEVIGMLAVAKDYYGKGGDAIVWRKLL